MKKIRVAVLFGGRSTEHQVSVRSAWNVVQYLDKSLFEVIPIGISQEGQWFLGQDVLNKSLEQQSVPLQNETSNTWFTPEWVNKAVQKTEIQSALSQEEKAFDVIFPAVHGRFCEDGSLQGLLELSDIPYVGCGVLASSVGMDKDICKRLAINAGIAVGPYLVIKQGVWKQQASAFIQKVSTTLSYPVFVKPANTGSSVGISKVKKQEDLAAALDYAFKFDTKVLVEKALNVQELEIAVLESLDSPYPIVSTVGEIRPIHEFYSYRAKYLDENGAEPIIPAPVSEDIKNKAQAMAKELFLALECEGMARVDLFLDKDNQQLYFNEINTLPGFTQISMYPKLMQASGLSYPELLTHLVKLAIKRHKEKSELENHCQE